MWLPTVALAGVLLMGMVGSVAGMELHVAVNGSDRWSGKSARPNSAKTDGPLASLEGARNRIRELKAGGLTKPMTVTVHQGRYTLTQPLTLEPQDSGSTYQAAKGARPVFSGGRRITGFTKGSDGVWTAKVPDVAAGKWYFEQLWINGKRATRARTPNKFWFYAQSPAKAVKDPVTGQVGDLSDRAFVAKREDIQGLAGLTSAEFNDVNLVYYHAWEIARHRLAGVDLDTNAVITTAAGIFQPFQYGPGQRYSLENFIGALDSPGEWFLHRNGTLYYIPLPGEDMTKAEVWAPVSWQFVVINGKPEAGQFVEDVKIKGLAFTHGQYLVPEKGQFEGQAAASLAAVVMADGAKRVSVEDCEIAHAGLYGIWFRRGCTDCSAGHNYIHDLGAGGIRIGEDTPRKDSPNEQTHRNTADNNIIRNCGRIEMAAVGVWIGQSSYNQITHNDISDLFYSGVSMGWSWGYAPTLCDHNTIAFNHIHHIGHGVLSDMGGVYTLGISEGTTISNNVIHDVYSWNRYGAGGWGIYNDEGSTHITSENNLVYDTRSAGYQQHYGKENTIRNNILAFGGDGQLQRSRPEEHLSFTLENNIIYSDGRPLLAGNFNAPGTKMESNLYWGFAPDSPVFAGQTFDQWQATGQDKGSILADPKFSDPANRDFRLAKDSPALKIGFKPFDYAKAGVYGSPAWAKLAKDFTYPKLEYGPEK